MSSRGLPEKPSNPSDVVLCVCTLLILLIWGGVAAYTVHPILPANALELPFEERSAFLHLLPQGWSFFTLNPRLPRLTSFTRTSDGGWTRSVQHAWYKISALGFSRKTRLRDIEGNFIIRALVDAPWRDCAGSIEHCLSETESVGAVDNVLLKPHLCGDIGFVNQPPVPWAWSQSSRQVAMPFKVLRVRVVCH